MKHLILLLVLFKVATATYGQSVKPVLSVADTCVNYKKLPPVFDAYMEGKTAVYEGMSYIWRADSRTDFGDTFKYIGDVTYKAFDMSVDSLFEGLLPNMPEWTDSNDYCWFYSELNH
jgi:hypothetical protein